MARRKTETDYEDLADDLGWQWTGELPNSVVDETEWICANGHKIKRSYKRARERGCIYCNGHWLKEPYDYAQLAAIHGIRPPDKLPKNSRTPTKWKISDEKVIHTSFRDLLSRTFSLVHGNAIDEATLERLQRRNYRRLDRGQGSQNGHP